MKSKFLGFNAMAALALLAAGSMFTSCYDTENGDVSVPYVAPDPVYTVVGQVVDAVTGVQVSGATITISGALTGSATTDANGNYRVSQDVKGGASGTVTVKAEKDGKEISGDITVDAIANGETAVYIKNLRLNPPTIDLDGVKVKKSSKTGDKEHALQGEYPEKDGYILALDLINDTSYPMEVTRSLPVDDGANIVGDAAAPATSALTRAVDYDDWEDAALAYITEDLGFVPEKKRILESYTFTIPAKNALKQITITYQVETITYTFIYGNEEVEKTVEVIRRRNYKPAFMDIALYHNHGHGHGQGHGHGDANAGGGIWE